jgi:hypothetical protein
MSEQSFESLSREQWLAELSGLRRANAMLRDEADRSRSERVLENITLPSGGTLANERPASDSDFALTPSLTLSEDALW